MTFLRGLLTARSHLAFLVGLAAAAAVIRGTSRQARGGDGGAEPFPALASLERAFPLRRPDRLDDRDRALARAAWSYVERNTDPRTGLAGSVEGFPSTTMWDTGSQLLAIVAAEELGVVSSAEAGERLRRALTSLALLPLCERLPNKAYDTRTLAMTDYSNRPAPRGVGWSAIDVGRVLVPLALLERRKPELTPLVERVVARWDLQALSDGAVLRGATRRGDGALERYQEGRLGYEQYASRALVRWGVAASRALAWEPSLELVGVEGAPVPRDRRLPRDHGGTHAAVLSEPWILLGLEDGLDPASAALARAVLGAQERRARSTGRLTAVSEDHVDAPVAFLYSAVLDGDDAWVAFGADGARAPRGLGFSSKAALGWSVLFAGAYPERLRAAALELVTDRGLLAGRWDATGEPNRALALNTNAVALEALAAQLRGPLLRWAGAPAAREKVANAASAPPDAEGQ